MLPLRSEDGAKNLPEFLAINRLLQKLINILVLHSPLDISSMHAAGQDENG